MRPRLHDDVRYVRCPDGVYMYGHAGACVLKGEQSYEWLERLAPYLSGAYGLENLVASLGAPQRAMVESVVDTLREQRLLVDAGVAVPHTLGAQELRVYASEIAFIRYVLDSPEHRFQRLREARIELVGAGPVLAAVLEAGLRSGWRRVRVRAPGSETEALRVAATDAQRDSRQDVAVVALAEPVEPTDVADLTVHIFHPAEGLLTPDVPSGTQVQVLVGKTEAWVTAVGPAARVDAESCWRRLAGQRAQAPTEDEDLLTGPVPSIIAGHVALSCFSYLTGLAATPAQPALTQIDLRSLAARVHPVRPFSLAGARRPGGAAASEERLDVGELLARVGKFTDERVGVLGRLGEDDLPQLPLALCRATVSDPAAFGQEGLPGWSPAPVVMGWGRDPQMARLRTVLAALAGYGDLVDRVAAPAEHLDLLSGRRRALPPAAARRVPYRAPVGVAAGLSWSDAVAAGLRAHCEALLAADQAYAAGVRVDPALVVRETGDERSDQLLRLLRAAGQDVELTDLGDVLGIPAYGFRSDAGPVAMTCAATSVEALRDGLERTLLQWQRPSLEQPLPIRWCVDSGAAQPGDPAEDEQCRALVGVLRRAGRVPVAVPLTVDDEVRALLPYLVRVVVCDA